jgi:hypothetical protein
MSSDSTAKLEAEFASLEADKLLQLVRVSEMAERFEDMCWLVKRLVTKRVESNKDLTMEERNLLSVAYKNVVGSKRASWRALDPAQDEDGETDPEQLKKYRSVVEVELQKNCKDILELLVDVLIPHSQRSDATGEQSEKDETVVFYLKMAGDYYRYLCEFSATDENVAKSGEFYTKAWDVAKEKLSTVHPTRLGLALNYSVCLFEIMKETDKACDMAKNAFDNAIDKLDDIEDATYKDATLIMQLLRDNLTLWTSDSQAD